MTNSHVTLLLPMEYSIQFETVTSGWSIVYIEGSQDLISVKICTSFSSDWLVIANSVDPDTKLHHVAFYLDLHY